MKKVLLLTLALLLLVCSVACSAKKNTLLGTAYDNAETESTKSDIAYPEDYLADGKYNGSTNDSVNENGFDASTGLDSDGSIGENDLANRKLIKRVRMEIETEQYDSFLVSVKSLISSSGAYIQNSTMYDRNGKNANRSATLTVRVPADRLNDFTDGIYGGATVTYYNEDLDDVTASYKDIESRIESLTIELDALNKLLADAVDLQYVISLHDRITDIRYELDRYESSIRNYDELISYSTVTLYITEVKRETIVDEQSTWEEIGSNLSENVSDIGEFFRRLFIDIASGIPYIIIISAIAGSITVIIIVKVKKHRKKINAKTEE